MQQNGSFYFPIKVPAVAQIQNITIKFQTSMYSMFTYLTINKIKSDEKRNRSLIIKPSH